MYIGIIGKSGKDKEIIAKLFGKTLAWIIDTKEPEEELDWTYLRNYNMWCERLMDGLDVDDDKDIYYASFSHPLKAIVSMITGIPFEALSDHDKKNNYIVNINTFEYKENDGTEKLITPEKLFRQRNRKLSFEYDDKQELDDVWMSLNDYVIYFGFYLCRNYMGKDIWTKVERISNKKFPPNDGIRIYPDIRTLTEKDYIKEQGGIIIRINQEPEVESVINDASLFDIDVDIEVPKYKDIREIYDVIYRSCYKIVIDNNLK